MRTRTATTTATLVAATAALVLTLGACSGSDSGDGGGEPDAKSSAEPTSTADVGEALEDAGLPDSPEDAEREALLAALRAVGPGVVGADEDKTIDAARDQCAAIRGGSDNLDEAAADRFAQGDTDISDAQGKAINEVLKQTLCP